MSGARTVVVAPGRVMDVRPLRMHVETRNIIQGEQEPMSNGIYQRREPPPKIYLKNLFFLFRLRSFRVACVFDRNQEQTKKERRDFSVALLLALTISCRVQKQVYVCCRLGETLGITGLIYGNCGLGKWRCSYGFLNVRICLTK